MAPNSAENASTVSLIRRMLGFAKPHWKLIAVALLLSLVFSGGRYARAYLMKPLVDDVMLPAHALITDRNHAVDSRTPEGLPANLRNDDRSATDPDPEAARAVAVESVLTHFWLLVLAAAVLIVVTPLVLFLRLYAVEYVMGRISVELKQQLAAKLLRLPLSFHRGAQSGDTLARALADSAAIERSIAMLLEDVLLGLTMIVVGTVTLISISWQLTLFALLTAPPIAAVLAFFARKIRRGARRRQEQLGEVTQRLVDILAGIKVIKAFAGEDIERSAFERETNKLFRRNMRVAMNRVLSRSSVEALNGATGIGMLMLGALIVMKGMWGITPGDVGAFAMVLATTYRPVKTLSRTWARLNEGVASSERFFEIMDTRTETPDPPDAIEIDGVEESIRFVGVGFAYAEEMVLQGVDLEIAAGEVVAFVGRSGEGKTTLMDLLLRFYDPNEGRIEIDGVDLRQITRRSLLAQLAIVTQEPFLFDTGIEDNIRYGRPDASHEEIIAAARAAKVDEFVDQLPDGYATQVGEFGLRLSGGQRQRITIARALVKHPAILVFDEATSALDVKTEQSVQDAIDALRGERTLLIVAHRLSTIQRADRIVVMSQGRVAQSGTHDELLNEPGLYRDLVASQRDDARE